MTWIRILGPGPTCFRGALGLTRRQVEFEQGAPGTTALEERVAGETEERTVSM